MSKFTKFGLLVCALAVVGFVGCGSGGGGSNGGTSTPAGFDFSNQGLSSDTSTTTMVASDGLAFSEPNVDIQDPTVWYDASGNAIITMMGYEPGADGVVGGANTDDDARYVYAAYYDRGDNRLQRPTKITGGKADVDEDDNDVIDTVAPSTAVVAFNSVNGDAVVIWANERATALDNSMSVWYTTFDLSSYDSAPTTLGQGWDTTASELGLTFAAADNDDVRCFGLVCDGLPGRASWGGDCDAGSYWHMVGSSEENDDVNAPLTYTNYLGVVVVQDDDNGTAGGAARSELYGSVWSGTAFGTPGAIAVPAATDSAADDSGVVAWVGFNTYLASAFVPFTEGLDGVDELDTGLCAVGAASGTTLSFAAAATLVTPAIDSNDAFVAAGTGQEILGPGEGLNNILGFIHWDPNTGVTDDQDLYWVAWNYETGAIVGAATAVADASGVTGGDVIAWSVNAGVSKDGDYALCLFVQEDNALAATDNDQGVFICEIPDSALGTAPTAVATQRLDHNPTPADANGDIDIGWAGFMENSVNHYNQFTSGAQSHNSYVAGYYVWNDFDSVGDSTVEDQQGRFWRYTADTPSSTSVAVITGLDCNVTTIGGVGNTDVNDMEVLDAGSSGANFVAYIRQQDGVDNSAGNDYVDRLYARKFEGGTSTSSMQSAVELGTGSGYDVTQSEVDIAPANSTIHFVTFLEDRSTASSTTAEDTSQVVRFRTYGMSSTWGSTAFSSTMLVDTGSTSSTLHTTMADSNEHFVLFFEQNSRCYYALYTGTWSTISEVSNPYAGQLTGIWPNPTINTLRGGDGTFFCITTQDYGTFDRAYVRLVQ